MGPRVQQLAVPSLKLGEGPHWQQHLQALLFVDVFAKALRRHYVHTGRHQVLYIDDGGVAETVTFAVPVRGSEDQLVVSVGDTLAVVAWAAHAPDTSTTAPLAVLHTTADDHFNDAKCDPQGRLWAGTMTPLGKDGELLEFHNSSLFRFDEDLSFTACVKKVTVSNGLAWSSDRKRLYYIDSPALCIYHFDYDDASGAISNQRVLLNYKEAGLEDQVPDGMTIDVDGNLWVACFGGSQVICVDPQEGRVVRRVAVPSPNLTSVCWGGRDYDTLYVTSGTLKLSPEQVAALPNDGPGAGGTFAITGLGTRGSPPSDFKVDLDKLKEMIKK